VYEHGEVCGRREERGPDTDSKDRRGRGLAVGGEVQAGNKADAHSVDGGDGLGEDAVGLEHGGDRSCGENKENSEGGGGGAADGVVTAVARAGNERALDKGECERGVGDFGEGPAGRRDGDEREVQSQEFAVVTDFVVGDGLRQRIVPDGVVREVRVRVCGERDPEPAGERGSEGERYHEEHGVELGLVRETEGGGVRGVGACEFEVDEDDGRGPVEAGKGLVVKIDDVVDDRQEEEIDCDNAARGLAADEDGDAVAVAGGGGTFVAKVGGGGEGLDDLFEEAYE